jgi:hypothetical protein
MTLQVVVLNTVVNQSDQSFSVSGVFWLTAPANSVVLLPEFKSQYPSIDSATLLSLQAGTIVEQAFSSGQFPVDTAAGDVQTALVAQYTAAQETLNSTNPPVSGVVGSVFDGTSWTTPTAQTYLPSPIIASAFNQFFYRWTTWKGLYATKGAACQYTSDGITYTIRFYDGSDAHLCTIWLGTVPAAVIAGGYSQAQNNSDKSDFETNFKPTANAPVQPKAADGRPDVRMTAASKARNFNLRIFSFATGIPSSLVNKDSNFNNLSDITLTCYDGSGNPTTDPTVAVKTVADLEPTFNYEVIGGWIDTPSSILGGVTGEWWISCVGIPDIPFAYGGSVNFVYPANLELVYTQKIVSDGRASQYLTYSPTYHTNKLRWIMKHPANVGTAVQVYVETFV